jgi:hypothetical protein
MATHDVINGVRRKINEVLKRTDEKIVVGWRPPAEDHKEGDVWEASDGRQWTIKNGIKQTVTKLDLAKTPIFCPQCTHAMSHRFDSKYWASKGKCFACVVREETEMRRLGTWEEYHNTQRRLSQIDFLKDKLQELEDARNSVAALTFINAEGTNLLMTERWDVDVDRVKADIDEEIQKARELLTKLENSNEPL